ncbi:MAG: helix-turn-helix domain-containing protein [Candidatus Omnitrophota bacterium]
MMNQDYVANKNKDIMTAKDVAEYLQLHLLTVHRYAREGKIPAFKIGTDWRFHRKYIEKWIRGKLSDSMRSNKEQELALIRNNKNDH